MTKAWLFLDLPPENRELGRVSSDSLPRVGEWVRVGDGPARRVGNVNWVLPTDGSLGSVAVWLEPDSSDVYAPHAEATTVVGGPNKFWWYCEYCDRRGEGWDSREQAAAAGRQHAEEYDSA